MNLRSCTEHISLMAFEARFKIFKLVFLTNTFPLAVYLTSKTIGTGSSGAPFFFFLFRSKTSSLSFYFSLCCSSYSSVATISPIEPNNLPRDSSLLKLFLDNPRNSRVLLYYSKWLISPTIAGVKLFPYRSKLLSLQSGIYFTFLINSLAISSPIWHYLDTIPNTWE